MGIDHCDLDRYTLLIIRCLIRIKRIENNGIFSADSVVYRMREKSSINFVGFQSESGNVNEFPMFQNEQN